MAEYNITAGNTELLSIAKKHADSVLLLDFYADWCGPCKRIAPKVHELVRQYGGAVVLCKVNVEEEGNEDACEAYKISAMPTFVWIAQRRVLERMSGADIASLESITKKIVDKN